jgi:enoyl-CoA hydratase/carnithine racemase
VGMGWFLARTPGALGRFLAVTGETIDAPAALYAGLADAYLDESAWPALIDALETEPFATGNDVVARIRREAAASEEVRRIADACALAEARAWIDRHFGLPDVPAIAASLDAAQREAQGPESEWAEQMAGVLRERSPLSMAVSLEVVSRAEGSMADVLRRDLDLTRSTFAQGDVIEGIRARIIDKDNRPNWRFARIDEVPRVQVERMFESPWSEADHPLRSLKG